MDANEMISKEDVPFYHFVSFDVLDQAEQKEQRVSDLQRAMFIGNGDKAKTRLSFHTEQGVKEVETTVWATTDETVTLKGGVVIPIHCISRVSFV
jgi:hypothetical protein